MDPWIAEAGHEGSDLTLTVYTVPWPEADVHHVVVAADGSVWLTDMWNSCIGRLVPESGEITAVGTPEVRARPHGMAADPDGSLWYAGTAAGVIGRVDPTSLEVREYALPGGGRPHSVATAGDAVWFTVTHPAALGRLDRGTGEIVLHRVDDAEGTPYDITADGDRLWMTVGNRIARVPARIGEPAIELREVGADDISGITVNRSGEVWYADRVRSRLGRLDGAGGATTWFETTEPNAAPRALATGPDDRIWYYEERGHRLVGRLGADDAPVIVSIPELPEPGATVRSIAADHERGLLWIALGPGGAVASVAVGRRGAPESDGGARVGGRARDALLSNAHTDE